MWLPPHPGSEEGTSEIGKSETKNEFEKYEFEKKLIRKFELRRVRTGTIVSTEKLTAKVTQYVGSATEAIIRVIAPGRPSWLPRELRG